MNRKEILPLKMEKCNNALIAYTNLKHKIRKHKILVEAKLFVSLFIVKFKIRRTFHSCLFCQRFSPCQRN